MRQLLTLNPAKRLGMLAGGGKAVLAHPLCAGIDPQALLRREITPPFVPTTLAQPVPDVGSSPSGGAGGEGGHAECLLGGGERYDAHLDARYDAMWEREFGVKAGAAADRWRAAAAAARPALARGPIGRVKARLLPGA